MTTITEMQKRFEVAEAEALKEVEEDISSLYANGEETVDFRFDAFSFWGKTTGGADDLWGYLDKQQLYTDDWLRAVWSLTKEQALKIAMLIEQWNAPWQYDIARYYDDQDGYYNAYHISFSPATGTEHIIKAGAKGRSNAWQWN